MNVFNFIGHSCTAGTYSVAAYFTCSEKLTAALLPSLAPASGAGEAVAGGVMVTVRSRGPSWQDDDVGGGACLTACGGLQPRRRRRRWQR